MLESPLDRAKYLLELQGTQSEVYVPEPEFFSDIANLQTELQTKSFNKKTLTDLLNDASVSTLTYREEIANEFAKEPQDSAQISLLIGKFEWTLRTIAQISSLLDDHEGTT